MHYGTCRIQPFCSVTLTSEDISASVELLCNIIRIFLKNTYKTKVVNMSKKCLLSIFAVVKGFLVFWIRIVFPRTSWKYNSNSFEDP